MPLDCESDNGVRHASVWSVVVGVDRDAARLQIGPQGGIPITVEGKVIGAIGASGNSPEEMKKSR
jgi:uncharacterized protein GlcG (DUF336 family)